MTTKTKTKKIDTLRPPQDIRENTKARRAWLAAKAAEINGGVVEGGTLAAKIVGQGSYQEISVYVVSTVEARERLRGVCQCCGNEQVVQGEPGVLVLHGYKRPGDGQTFGRCPGTGKAPLNDSSDWTRTWYLAASTDFERAKEEYDAASTALRAAQSAMYDSGEMHVGDRLECTSQREMPRSPKPISYRQPVTAEQIQEYRDALAAWAVKFPLTKALLDAQTVQRDADNQMRRAHSAQTHFNRLLNSGIKGTPLTVEVV